MYHWNYDRNVVKNIEPNTEVIRHDVAKSSKTRTEVTRVVSRNASAHDCRLSCKLYETSDIEEPPRTAYSTDLPHTPLNVVMCPSLRLSLTPSTPVRSRHSRDATPCRGAGSGHSPPFPLCTTWHRFLSRRRRIRDHRLSLYVYLGQRRGSCLGQGAGLQGRLLCRRVCAYVTCS